MGFDLAFKFSIMSHHKVAQMADLTHSQHSIRAVDFIFQSPAFTAPMFSTYSSIPKPSASRILNILREKEVLYTVQEGKGRRPGIYAFRELIDIVE